MSTGVTSSGASLLRTSLVSLPLETHNFNLKLLSSDDFPETFVEMLALDTEGMRCEFSRARGKFTEAPSAFEGGKFETILNSRNRIIELHVS